MTAPGITCPNCHKRLSLRPGVEVPAQGREIVCPACKQNVRVFAPAPPAAGPLDAAAHLMEWGTVPNPVPPQGSGDLPAPRESVPRPDPLPPARRAAPFAAPALPDDLLAPRDELPAFDDILDSQLPTPKTGGGQRVDLMDPLEIQRAPAPASMGVGASLSSPTAMSPGLDIFLGELPSASASPIAPLELELSAPGPMMEDLDLSGFAPPTPAAPDPADAGLDIGSMLESMMPGGDNAVPGLGAFMPPPTTRPGGFAPAAADAPDPFAPDPFAPPGPADPFASPTSPAMPARAPSPARPQAPARNAAPAMLPDLDLALDPPGMPADRGISASGAGLMPDLGLDNFPGARPANPTAGPPRAQPAPRPPAPASSESGFMLKLDAEGDPESASSVSRPMPAARAPERESLPNGVARLAPPRRKADARSAVAAPDPRRKLMIFGGAGAVAALVIGLVVWLVLPSSGGSPEKTLAPFAADLARDRFPAYAQGADALVAAAGTKPAPALRGRAAELLLIAYLAHGADKAQLTRAEQILAEEKPGVPAADLARARALVAVARGRSSEVETLLGTEASTADGQLVTGLRRLRERKLDPAIAALKAAAAQHADRALLPFLLGRALEEAHQAAEAQTAYKRALALNPQHPGALVGLARLSGGSAEQRATAAEALITKVKGEAGPGDLAEALVVLGEAKLALGRVAEAVDVLSRASLASPTNAGAMVSLAEALVADGRASEALARLKAADPIVVTSVSGRIATAGALIASGQSAQGGAQLEAVAAEAPGNPRVPFWLGAAAEGKRPPDDETAARRYHEALTIDPRFLPASLRLAALLERQGKAPEAIALIKEAERAGAPTAALELAWGQALIDANNAAEAETVFHKAVTRDGQLAAARTGLASALEAQGKLDQAAAELERAITELKGAAGLRERLSDLLLRRGKKDAALAQLEAQQAAGDSGLGLRVRIAKLAMALGQRDRAGAELAVAISQDPATPEALFTQARLDEANGDVPAALQDYKRALAFESEPDLHLAFGRALASAGRDEEALGQLSAAGDLPAARLELGRIRLRRNDVEHALADAEASVRLSPTDPQAQLLLGQCFDLLGRADDAAKAWQAALAGAPDLSEAHYHLGRYEMDKGRPAAALAHFRAATQKVQKRWEADLYFQLGFAEASNGTKPNAAAALKHYLQVAPADAPARPEAERELTKLGRH